MIGVTEPAATAAAAGRRLLVRERTLLACGLAMLVLFGAFVFLWVNFPPGFEVPWAPALDAVPIFRALWAYPAASIPPALFGPVAAGIILGLWACYLGSAWLLRPGRFAPPSHGATLIVVGLGLIFNFTLTFAMPPVLSSDVWDYGFEGRVVAKYGADPYLVTARDLADPIAPLMGWPDAPLRYGAVFPLLAAGAVRLAGDSLLATALAMKMLAVLFSLGAAGLIFLLTRRLNGESGLYPLMLYLWNPLVLVEVAGNGHNDVVMLGFALLGLWLAVAGHRLAGVGALALSFSVKFVSAPLVLFVVARELFEAGSWRRAAARVLWMAAVAAGVTLAGYLAFSSGVAQLQRMFLGSPVAGNANPNLLTTVPRDWIAVLMRARGTPVKLATVERDISRAWQLVFVILVLYLLYRMARGDRTWPRVIFFAGAMTLFYLVLVYAGNAPWYLILPLGLALAGPADRPNAWLAGTCQALCIAAMLIYAIFLVA